jgi:hypothetical protein
MGLATGPHAPTLRQLFDTDNRHGGLEDVGAPVPSPHQSDVSQKGNVPSATESQAAVRRVGLWQAREVMEMMPDQLCESYPFHGATACVVVDHVVLAMRLLSPLSLG